MCERNRLCFASHEQAWVVLRYGANRDELWTSDKFIPHFDHAPKLASFKYPNSEYDVLWVFDQKSNHTVKGRDALNTSHKR